MAYLQTQLDLDALLTGEKIMFQKSLQELEWDLVDGIGHWRDRFLLPYRTPVIDLHHMLDMLSSNISYVRLAALYNTLLIASNNVSSIRVLLDVTFHTDVLAQQKMLLLKMANTMSRYYVRGNPDFSLPPGLKQVDNNIEREDPSPIVPDLSQLKDVKVDKSDPVSYMDDDKAEGYVKENLPSRVGDLISILRCVPIMPLVFINDGAGAGYLAAKTLNRSSSSFDPSAAMLKVAKKIGTVVNFGLSRQVVDNSPVGRLFVVSHSEELDPGVVSYILDKKLPVVVYESKLGYSGYSRLYENHVFVRSTFAWTFPLLLSRPFKSLNVIKWIKLAQFSCFRVEEVSAVQFLYHISEIFGGSVSVYTGSPQVSEVAKSKGISVVDNDIGVDITIWLKRVNGKGRAMWLLTGMLHDIDVLKTDEGQFIPCDTGIAEINGKMHTFVKSEVMVEVVRGHDIFSAKVEDIDISLNNVCVLGTSTNSISAEWSRTIECNPGEVIFRNLSEMRAAVPDVSIAYDIEYKGFRSVDLFSVYSFHEYRAMPYEEVRGQYRGIKFPSYYNEYQKDQVIILVFGCKREDGSIVVRRTSPIQFYVTRVPEEVWYPLATQKLVENEGFSAIHPTLVSMMTSGKVPEESSDILRFFFRPINKKLFVVNWKVRHIKHFHSSFVPTCNCDAEFRVFNGKDSRTYRVKRAKGREWLSFLRILDARLLKDWEIVNGQLVLRSS